MPAPILTSGRFVLTLGNIVYAIGTFMADYSDSHIKNPHWKPHAKFHNGQTMSLSICLAATSFYFTFRPCFSNAVEEKESAFAAAWIGSLYCFAGLTAILYPGTAWFDPEHPNGGGQKYIFQAIVALMWVGYWLESRRIAGQTRKEA